MITETKHTPGPWLVDGNVIRGDSQINGSVTVACILNVAYPYGRWAGESAIANARLIASAPELLDVLKELAALDFGALVMNDDDERRIDFVARKARTAIAKATGETQ